MESRDRSNGRWNVLQKVAFRFFATFFTIYILPWPLGTLPYTEDLVKPWNDIHFKIIPWIGQNLMGLPPIVIFPNGSGDTTYNYVEILCYSVIALLVTVIWSVVDRDRPNHARLHDWVRMYVRFFLGYTMLSYGLAKVIQTQFPFPMLEKLTQPLGEMSPMGLLWTFMGFSYPYNVFSGLGEVVGGGLLFFRRTTTLGALILVGVVGHIVMLNFSYDVPVKLFSSMLLAMAIFLLVPDLKRLLDVLVLNRPTKPVELGSLFGVRVLEIAARLVAAGYLVYLVVTMVGRNREMQAAFGSKAPKSPIYGIYDVESMVRNSDTIPMLLGDSTVWRRVIVASSQWLAVRTMRDTTRYYSVTLDSVNKRMILTPRVARRTIPSQPAPAVPDQRSMFHLTYTRPDSTTLLLDGLAGSDTIHMQLRRRDESKYLLVSRGFHWINEYPFHR
jgi:hypothetical protein